MNLRLRFYSCMFVTATTIGAWAQAPASGTYHIRSAQGTYVEVKGKYYAKPDASTTNDYTQIGVGIGYKNDGGYRVFSLSGKNPNGGSPIEVYDYVDKAYRVVSMFAQSELIKKAEQKLGEQATSNVTVKSLLDAANAMADSICAIYTDDYAYMTLMPEAHYGNKWLVRAKATVPAIPYTIQAVGNYIVTGADVRGDGHKATDVWDWAKQHVLKYLDKHNTDQRLKDMVVKYLDQVHPGTTYYLVYDQADNSFGYSTTPNTDNGLWTMEEVSTTADGLQPGVKNIKNNATNYYVNVMGKYDAEPNLTLDDIQASADNKKNASITLDFGRYSRTKDNFYRITELSNQGQDVVGYISKGMEKTFKVLNDKLKENNLYEWIANTINAQLQKKNISYSITADSVRADVKTAIDLCSDHYAYMKLIDNGDGSVSLRVDVPQVPALLDLAVKLLKRDQTATFEDFAKDQITKYFNSSETTENLKKLWRQNKNKWQFGHTYYLSAESASKTFEFTETATDNAAKWTLDEVNTTSNTNPYQGYFRAKNVGSGNYATVKGRISADITTTTDNKYLAPGTILYINMNANPVKVSDPNDASKTVNAYEVLNLRSQGIDVTNGGEGDITDYDIQNFSLSSVYNGYMGFARFALKTFTELAEQHLENNYSWVWREAGYAESEEASKTAFKNLVDDFKKNNLPELKMPVYLIPVEGKTNTYYCRSMIPSFKPISDFYNANKYACDRYLVPAVRAFLKYNNHEALLQQYGFDGEKFTQADDDIISSWYKDDGDSRGYTYKDLCDKDENNQLKGAGTKDNPWTLSYNTILSNDQYIFDWLKLQFYKIVMQNGKKTIPGSSYFTRIHYNTPYYLFAGDPRSDSSDKTKLGFGNDGSMSIKNDQGKDTKGYGQWTLEPVDDTNYFAVKPNQNRARNGKYYSSTYLDFPFKVKDSGVSAVYTLDGNVLTGKREDGTTYSYVTFDKATDDVIPAATPVIIEFNTPNVDNTIALQPVLSDARTTTDRSSLIQGTFLGGKHNVTTSNSDGLIKRLIKGFLAYKGSLQDKWGVGTNGKDLYTFGYNKDDKYNPYGFYIYSYSNEAEDSKYNLIPANKPFLIQDPNASGAKVYVMFSDGTTTAIENVFSGDTEIPADAPRYNLSGERVGKDYKGVVIVKGHKYVQQ